MASRRKRTSERPPASTSVGRMTILLEQIHEQNRATIEAVQSQGSSLRRDMEELERRLGGRIDALEAAVRQHSTQIRENTEQTRQNTEQLREHSDQIRQNTEQLRQHSDQIRQNTEQLRQHSAEIEQLSNEVRNAKEQLADLTRAVNGKPDATALQALEARVTNLERRLGI